MGTIGTFDGFTTARLAIYAAHQGLNVTGHNIANLNTSGYTRQVIDQVSLKVGANDLYRSQMDNHVGTGVLVTGINQIRDPYLDIRYRNTTSDVGYLDNKLAGLQEIADILDEVGKGENKGDGLLYAQLQDLAKSLRALGDTPNSDNDTLTRASAESLVALFNTYAGKLQTLKENTEKGFKQSISTVNEILTNIRNLNDDIRKNEIFGDNALELRDERNRQIDKLSEYMKINVTYSMEDIGAGQQVEKLTITLGDANPNDAIETDTTVLIDGIFGAQIEAAPKLPEMNPSFNLTDEATGDPLPNSEYLYIAKDGYTVDGKPFGFTNDLSQAKISDVDNSNYLISTTKLVDSKGREWENPKTIWTPATGGTRSEKAVYQVKLNTSQWNDKDEISIAGTVYTIGEDIDLKDANNTQKMAAFIAQKLNAKTDSEYRVTANGDTIVFTAKNAGTVPRTNDGKGPMKAPDLTLINGGNKISFGTMDNTTVGVDGVAPTNPPADTTTNPDGSETTISYVETADGWQQVKTVTEHTKGVLLHDNDLYGRLQATRELLTEKGEFATEDDITLDPDALIKRGIPYYQKSLDLLARQVAKQYNSLNQGFMVNQDGNYIKKDGSPIMLEDADGVEAPVSKTTGLTVKQRINLANNTYGIYNEDGTQVLDEDGVPLVDMEKFNDWLEAHGAYRPEGAGNLFSIRNDKDVDWEDGEGITASNISIAHKWSSREVKVVPTHVQLFGEDGKPLEHTTQSENINHMITMIDTKLVYDPKDLDPDAAGDNIFTGSFNDMLSNACTVLGNDDRVTTTKLNNSYTTQVTIDTTRDGVSGVDLNDEAMNMMTYQKAYTAACRLMTAMDEALDRLINNTGIAGR